MPHRSELRSGHSLHGAGANRHHWRNGRAVDHRWAKRQSLVGPKREPLQAATFESLSFYVTAAKGNLILGIYDATGPNGGPGALRASTLSFTPIKGWNTASVATPIPLAAGNYGSPTCRVRGRSASRKPTRRGRAPITATSSAPCLANSARHPRVARTLPGRSMRRSRPPPPPPPSTACATPRTEQA